MTDTMTTPRGGKELTGRKVFAITATGFGIIIGVNLFMAYSAISTFPGLEVRNGYIASQSFDRERASQEALGLEINAAIGEAEVTLDIRSLAAIPVGITRLEGSIGRPTHQRDDQALMFQGNGRSYTAPVTPLEAGQWTLRLTGVADDGTPFRQNIPLYVRG